MVTYTINLDLTKDNFTVFKCKQNDDIVLNFNIYNNSLIEDLTGSAVILNALRNNNTFVKQTNNITIDKNIITINCLRDVTRVGGKLKLELVIIKDNKQTTTFNIDATVVNSVITDNAEASKNVVSVIEELDNKIAQGKEIVAEVDRKKTEAIDTVNKLKNDTIATVTELKDATITQLNNTKKDVETLKQQTITESTNIKDSAIKELSKIKTDSIKELTKIKQDSITELNNIKDTANTDLNKIKKDTIDTVNAAVNNAIAEINKYNIKEVNDKIDNHIADKNLHVTKELKDSITKNATDLEEVKKDLNNSTLVPFTTDKTTTKLDNSTNGFITDLNIKGKSVIKNNVLKSVAEDENNKIEISSVKSNGVTGDKLSIPLSEPLRGINDSIYDEIKDGKIIRRCGQFILNGSESWALHPWTPLQTKTIAFSLDDKGLNLNQKASGYSISSKIKAVIWDELCENDTDSIAIASDSSIIIKVDRAEIGLSSSDTDTIKIQKLKTWLQSNNVTFVFQLKTTTTEPLSKSLILPTFKDCSLKLSNSIMPTVSGKYPTNLGGGLESVAVVSTYGVQNEVEILKKQLLETQAMFTDSQYKNLLNKNDTK